MRIDAADGVRQVTRAEWHALQEQCERVHAESAQVRDVARRAMSEAVERRLRSDDGRFELDE
jgi:hypothetical protein